MEGKVLKLIEAIENSSADNNIIIICTVISCAIALMSLLISLYLGYLQFKDSLLKI